jgi:Fe-S cluster biosynthesis and repair protein YggX
MKKKKKYNVFGPEGVWSKWKKRNSLFVNKKFLDIINVYDIEDEIIIEIENFELTPKREFMKKLGEASFKLSIKETDKMIKALKKAKRLAIKNKKRA